MFSHEDREAIVRFVFSKEENVELALGVLAAGQAIREKIIKEFLAKLEDELRRKVAELGESWKVVNDLIKDPFKHRSMVYIAKEQWHDLYWIALLGERCDARGFVLGVLNNWDKLRERLDEGRIKQALERLVRSGMTNDWWPFYMWADPYRDWGDEATLCSFLGDRGSQAARALSDTILTIARATEGIIDSLVRDWRQRQQTK